MCEKKMVDLVWISKSWFLGKIWPQKAYDPIVPEQAWDEPERTKQMEEILNFQKPSEGLELVVLLHTQY